MSRRSDRATRAAGGVHDDIATRGDHDIATRGDHDIATRGDHDIATRGDHHIDGLHDDHHGAARQYNSARWIDDNLIARLAYIDDNASGGEHNDDAADKHDTNYNSTL
jgi:hypothetical protein